LVLALVVVMLLISAARAPVRDGTLRRGQRGDPPQAKNRNDADDGIRVRFVSDDDDDDDEG